MAHLYRVIRFPKGSNPRYLVWHHLWLSLGLTALGVLLGWLTLPLAAAADSELSSQALMDYYLQQPMLLWLNLLAPVLLIWLFYFLTRRGWCAFSPKPELPMPLPPPEGRQKALILKA